MRGRRVGHRSRGPLACEAAPKRAALRTPSPTVVQPSAASPPRSPLTHSPESEEGLALSLESTC